MIDIVLILFIMMNIVFSIACGLTVILLKKFKAKEAIQLQQKELSNKKFSQFTKSIPAGIVKFIILMILQYIFRKNIVISRILLILKTLLLK